MASDALTVSNRPQAEILENYLEQYRKRTMIRILPVPGSTDLEEEPAGEEPSDFLKEFFQTFQKVIVVPGDIGSHRDLEALFDHLVQQLLSTPDAAVLFAGGWGTVSPMRRRSLLQRFEARGLGPRFLISGPLSAECERFCLGQARVVFIASLPTESLELTRILRQALATSAVLVMNTEQVALDPLQWRDRENAFFSGVHPSSWGATLNIALSSDDLVMAIRSRLPEFVRTEILDQPGNVMSRIYADVLAQKHQ